LGLLLIGSPVYLTNFANAGHVAPSCPAVSGWSFDLKTLRSKVPQAKEVQFLRKAVEKGFPVPETWREQLRKIQGTPVGNQLLVVNALVNGIRYTPDKLDNWQYPREFLAKGGDCEDFAIAKYVLLRQLGFRRDDLRVILVKKKRGAADYHFVLAVKTGPKPADMLMLDIHHDYPRTIIYCDDYTAILSFNEKELWHHGTVVGDDPRDIWGNCGIN